MRSKDASILLVCLLILSGFPDINATDAKNDMNTGGDAIGTFTNSPSIVLIEGQIEGTGYLEIDDSDDVFALSVGFHKVVSVEMTPPEGANFDLYMYIQNEWSRPEYVSEKGGSEVEFVVYNSAGGILGAESETDMLYAYVKKEDWLKPVAKKIINKISQGKLGMVHASRETLHELYYVSINEGVTLDEYIARAASITSIKNLEFYPTTYEVDLLALVLMQQYRIKSIFDAYHAATALNMDQDHSIISNDTVYDKIPGLIRVDPHTL